MLPIDLDKLTAILNAAQNPAFKKLLEEKTKAQKALDDAKAQLAEVEARLSTAIPPELRTLLIAPAPVKMRKQREPAEPTDLKRPDLQELKEILSALPNKTLNIRSEGYETRNIKVLAEANPHILRYEKGTWPKVTYLR